MMRNDPRLIEEREQPRRTKRAELRKAIRVGWKVENRSCSISPS
jgi:hypothetical protein